MIQEAYVSLEVAKLLNEKGFDGYCHVSKEEVITTTGGEWGSEIVKTINIPTQQKAMRWLREVHNLCIAPYAAAYRYGFTIDKADTGSNLGNETKFYPDEEFETYEEAVEAALK